MKRNFVKPHWISSHSAHSDNFYFHILFRCVIELKFYEVSQKILFLGFTKFFLKKMPKVSAFYLEKQRSFIPKKYFRPLSINKELVFDLCISILKIQFSTSISLFSPLLTCNNQFWVHLSKLYKNPTELAEIKLQIVPFFIFMSTFEQYCIDKNQVVLGFGLSYSLSTLILNDFYCSYLSKAMKRNTPQCTVIWIQNIRISK